MVPAGMSKNGSKFVSSSGVTNSWAETTLVYLAVCAFEVISERKLLFDYESEKKGRIN